METACTSALASISIRANSKLNVPSHGKADTLPSDPTHPHSLLPPSARTSTSTHRMLPFFPPAPKIVQPPICYGGPNPAQPVTAGAFTGIPAPNCGTLAAWRPLTSVTVAACASDFKLVSPSRGSSQAPRLADSRALSPHWHWQAGLPRGPPASRPVRVPAPQAVFAGPSQARVSPQPEPGPGAFPTVARAALACAALGGLSVNSSLPRF